MKIKRQTKTAISIITASIILVAGVFCVQYFAKAINVTDITPSTGSITGGQEVTITGDFGSNSMQQMTAEYCANEMSTYPTGDDKPDTITRIDARDNQEYRIRKLADGNCWMIDDLALRLTQGMTLTSDTTNVPENEPKTVDFAWDSFILGTYDGDSNFVKTGYLTVNGYSSPYSSNLDAWRQVNPNDSSMSNSTNCINNTGNADNGGVSYSPNSKTGCGYLYNYYTATVGSAAQADYNNGKGAGYIAQQSICPAGWKLPSGQNASGDFGILDKAYPPGTGSGHDLVNPDTQGLWLSAGAWQGTFNGNYRSSLGNQGLGGIYWSSSVSSAEDSAYGVAFFYSDYVYPGTGSLYRDIGLAVRCLADKDYMSAPVAPVVIIGGVAATVVSYSDTEIVIKTPEHSAGKVDVTVTRGSQTFTLSDAYEYFNVPDVPNTGTAKASVTMVVVQSSLATLIIAIIGAVIFITKPKKAPRR
ncbi:MAG: IPT/TIG domain-containing protein [Candidatus Nomurabacteria bacterium]|jgi:hypothetical protein|nr:IPT/TIG domain-containing protein [Candidatus Nomurabacteria bacterium]